MNVRLAVVEDVPVVAAMLDEATAFVRTMGRDQWPVPFPEEELRERIDRDELYVVDVDGEPAATFTLLLDDPKFWGERPPDAVYLHKLAVRRAFGGRRLGVRIVEWIGDEAARRGRAFIRLDCQRDLPGIRRYYERLGFEQRGELERGTFAWALYERAAAVGMFEVGATDGAARAGVLRTAHGEVPTPAFMPVGTKGTVKTVDPEELRALGTTILLGNTYHLHFRPGEDLIAELGGLHRFMAWDGPILTDSGGFQVFSLRDTVTAVDDDGVTFRSVYDGQPARFTPELAAEIQAKLGSDVAMCLDICAPVEVSRRELEDAVRRTTEWARRQRVAPRAEGQLVFGIAQGASDSELRRRSIAELVDLDFDGYALGGLAIGEERPLMFATTAWAAELLPADRPRYFMGIGDPEGILEVIERGVDMFDCVLPTRTARTGSALTWEGRLNLRNARFARDPRPLDDDCGCPACRRFSRAYLRHLINQNELLGLRLLSLHNLRFLLDLTANARAAIERGGLQAFKAEALERLAAAG